MDCREFERDRVDQCGIRQTTQLTSMYKTTLADSQQGWFLNH